MMNRKDQEHMVPEDGYELDQMGVFTMAPVAQNQQELSAPRDEVNHVVHVRTERRLPRLRTLAAGGIVVALAFGGYKLWQGLFSEGGSHFEGSVDVEETRVYEYANTPINLAGIESDLDLTLEAGYDRTGPFGIDVNPINNQYTFNQDNLTTRTEATLTVGSMHVEEDSDAVRVKLSGDFALGRTSIDWTQEEFAGADIKSSSLSIGNAMKDQIDNDALEILQTSGSVAAACALRSEEVAPLLTSGVKEFLQVVNPNLDNEKPLVVEIVDLERQATEEYTDAIDEMNDVIGSIKEDYSGENDTFNLDTTGITDCDRQNIRLIEAEE